MYCCFLNLIACFCCPLQGENLHLFKKFTDFYVYVNDLPCKYPEFTDTKISCEPPPPPQNDLKNVSDSGDAKVVVSRMFYLQSNLAMCFGGAVNWSIAGQLINSFFTFFSLNLAFIPFINSMNFGE